MSIERPNDYLVSLVHELCKLPQEMEWLEFKQNRVNEEEIGEYISALANSASILGKVSAYMVWGVDDQEHHIVGTSFQASQFKIGNEELESWLLRLLEPKINFHFFELNIDDKSYCAIRNQSSFSSPRSI
jgi:predicted HTH transcriptional regulator